MVALGTPVAKLKAVHHCAKADKQDLNDAMGSQSVLYLADAAEVMLTSNLWYESVLYNGAKVQVIDFV